MINYETAEFCIYCGHLTGKLGLCWNDDCKIGKKHRRRYLKKHNLDDNGDPIVEAEPAAAEPSAAVPPQAAPAPVTEAKPEEVKPVEPDNGETVEK